jgi:hypothetical protein
LNKEERRKKNEKKFSFFFLYFWFLCRTNSSYGGFHSRQIRATAERACAFLTTAYCDLTTACCGIAIGFATAPNCNGTPSAAPFAVVCVGFADRVVGGQLRAIALYLIFRTNFDALPLLCHSPKTFAISEF